MSAANAARMAARRITTPSEDFQTPTDEQIQMLRKDIRAQRKQLIAANMKLTGAEAEKFWETCGPCHQMGPVSIDLYKRFGVFPIGDTANPGGGAWPYWYHTDDATEKRWQEDPEKWYSNHFFHLEKNIAQIKAIGENQATPVKQAFPPKMSGEVMVPLGLSATIRQW